eukprot:CAMPEP_0182899708 /NCGR_PEP_ID=MMETSP0034_2-20130328/28237_1 /TAXON_ID=156128 /ORGANISM="Nephroselmis pyriformis, Strain CCMP717" /LENGTH=334 /DNA_ID=CAMNT_0025033759 /DNA_START=212 /DNA_END=1212 /DNA_ORIENTATION=-
MAAALPPRLVLMGDMMVGSTVRITSENPNKKAQRLKIVWTRVSTTGHSRIIASEGRPIYTVQAEDVGNMLQASATVINDDGSCGVTFSTELRDAVRGPTIPGLPITPAPGMGFRVAGGSNPLYSPEPSPRDDAFLDRATSAAAAPETALRAAAMQARKGLNLRDDTVEAIQAPRGPASEGGSEGVGVVYASLKLADLAIGDPAASSWGVAEARDAKSFDVAHPSPIAAPQDRDPSIDVQGISSLNASRAHPPQSDTGPTPPALSGEPSIDANGISPREIPVDSAEAAPKIRSVESFLKSGSSQDNMPPSAAAFKPYAAAPAAAPAAAAAATGAG